MAWTLFGPPPVTALLRITESSDPKIDVIFVHGLGGDPIETWRMKEHNSWPAWIARAAPNTNIWSLRYRIRSTFWAGGAMPLTTRATNVLATIDSELTESRPIVFICHSYGGLLVKQMLRTAIDIATDYREFANRVVAIVFFGTPNGGTPIASFISALKPLLRTSSAVDELRQSAALLQDLNYWFRQQARTKNWELRAYFETARTYGAIVVDESSADLGLPDNIPIGIDANHIDICKPTSIDVRVNQTVDTIVRVTRWVESAARLAQEKELSDPALLFELKKETACWQPCSADGEQGVLLFAEFTVVNKTDQSIPLGTVILSDHDSRCSKVSSGRGGLTPWVKGRGAISIRIDLEFYPPIAAGREMLTSDVIFSDFFGNRYRVSSVTFRPSVRKSPITFDLNESESGWHPCSSGGKKGTSVFAEWVITNSTDDMIWLESVRLAKYDAQVSSISEVIEWSGRVMEDMAGMGCVLRPRTRTRIRAEFEFYPSIISGGRPLIEDVIFTAKFGENYTVLSVKFPNIGS